MRTLLGIYGVGKLQPAQEFLPHGPGSGLCLREDVFQLFRIILHVVHLESMLRPVEWVSHVVDKFVPASPHRNARALQGLKGGVGLRLDHENTTLGICRAAPCWQQAALAPFRSSSTREMGKSRENVSAAGG